MKANAPGTWTGRARSEPWNINIHYDRLLRDLARPGERVLDVGCGDGFLSASLPARGCLVTGLDLDPEVLARARQRWPDAAVEWLPGDLMTADLPAEAFDLVVSNAALHHLPDSAAALQRMASLTRPGGTVGVVGFASNGPLDWPRSLLGAVGIFFAVRLRGTWEHTAPTCWPPPLTYGQMRRLSGRALPGRRYRRLWLGRYLMTWHKPL